ncbi:MAG: leucine-rich repeat protein [Prevotella sp.]|nr:leucine-rich repeat protein [Prevotella sp.]
MTISEGITSIGGAAFWGCGGLTSVTIPNSVTSIGNCAFLGCPNLTSIISWITPPFSISGMHDSTRTFDSRIYDKATLFVPIGTVDLYKKTYGWKDFWYIEEMNNTDGIENNNRKTITANRYFYLNGLQMEDVPTQKGIYIRNGKKVLMK